MTTIDERLKKLIEGVVPERGRFRVLEELTRIKEKHWKNWWYGQQRPYAIMIQAMARLWPEYAFWLVTGIDDAEYGHASATETPPSVTDRSFTGKLLRRKVEFDEKVNLTMSVALHHEETANASEEIIQSEMTKLVQRFLEGRDELLAEHGNQMDQGKTLDQLYRDVLSTDKVLKKLWKERRGELKENDRTKK
jgi:hypothetical protein